MILKIRESRRETFIAFFVILLILSVSLFDSCNFSQTGAGHEMKEDSSHEKDEESGTQFGSDETYDDVLNGVRLILSYDPQSDSFGGTVENITGKMIRKIRVEVHLSNGVELGPTNPLNLTPEDKQCVSLSAEGQEFKTWSAHAESGSNEHGHEGEEGHKGSHDEEGEHGKEGKGEHNY